MVNPHFFFKGKLSREESASALLATLLEQSSKFRKRFCRLVNIETSTQDGLCVEVERNDVDVILTIESSSTSVIIEVKISGASKVDGQLATYYERAKAESPENCFVCVYVAPTSALGRSEVGQLDLRSDDSGFALSWEQVIEAAANLPDFDLEFATEGLQVVLDIIANKRGTYFDRTGDRAFLYDVVDAANKIVQDRTQKCSVATWKGKRCVEVYTYGTALSISVSIHFETQDNGHVVLVRDNGIPAVSISARFRPARKYAKLKNTNEWWSKVARLGRWTASDYTFQLSSDDWMMLQKSFVGNAADIASQIAELTLVLIEGLSDQLIIENPASHH